MDERFETMYCVLGRQADHKGSDNNDGGVGCGGDEIKKFEIKGAMSFDVTHHAVSLPEVQA